MDTNNDGLSSENKQNIENKAFRPTLVHILIVIAVIVALSVFIFAALTDGKGKPSYFDFAVKDRPIDERDFMHIFSGNYDGKSLLVTVKDVKNENGKIYMIYDLKCDFIPVASGCRCEVNILERTYNFGVDNTLRGKVPLGKGTILRSSAGKIIFKDDSSGKDKIDLLQL